MRCSFQVLNYRTNITIYRYWSPVKPSLRPRRRLFVPYGTKRRPGSGDVAVGEDDAAQNDDVAVAQGRLEHPAAVDERAVGAAVVEDPRACGPLVQDRGPAGDALVVEPDVGREAAADVGRAGAQGQQQALAAVLELEVAAGGRAVGGGDRLAAFPEAHTGQRVEDGGAGVLSALGEEGAGRGHDGTSAREPEGHLKRW